jgi:hypothetical protein
MIATNSNTAALESELKDSELDAVSGGWGWGATAKIVLSKGGTPETAMQVTYGAGLTPEQQA